MVKKIVILLFVVMIGFAGLLIGAKFHGDVIDTYRQFISTIGLQDTAAARNGRMTSEQRRQELIERINNERDFSHLDQVSRLDISEHQAYLQSLLEKYSDTLAIPEMIEIPGGSFEMGCRREQCPAIELPRRTINIKPFKIAATELTFEQWDLCVADGGCDIMPNDYGWGRADRPVLNVSWDDTQRYLKWLNEKTGENYRLPTEAEWEYAARAGQQEHDYPWEKDIAPSCKTDKANGARFGVAAHFKKQIGECDDYGTAPVGSFAPNAWGLYDVLGNVAEYAQDCAGGYDLTQVPSDGSAYEDKLCFRRVQRGGAWTSVSGVMFVTMRRHYHRWQTYDRTGFRLALDIQR